MWMSGWEESWIKAVVVDILTAPLEVTHRVRQVCQSRKYSLLGLISPRQ